MVDCQPNVINPLLHCSSIHVYMHQLKGSEYQTLFFIKFAMLGNIVGVLENIIYTSENCAPLQNEKDGYL